MFKHALLIPALAFALLAANPAAAECYADYKAKQDNPLRLHYGVIALPNSACKNAKAKRQITARIASDGWKLLKVLSIFNADGLAQRQESAGEYYLRY